MDLQKLVNEINKTFDPVSIFLYGSRARTDFLSDSDYEIGVLYKKERRITRTQLQELNDLENIRLYPFEYDGFLRYEIDTPFPESLYFRELSLSGKTISGLQIIETLSPPAITLSHLLERVSFDIGLALGAVLSYRNKDFLTARILFSKSCLFGVRNLIILRLRIFPLTYDDILCSFPDVGGINSEYLDVVNCAFRARKGEQPQEFFLYKNLSLLNMLVKYDLRKVLKEKGDITIFP